MAGVTSTRRRGVNGAALPREGQSASDSQSPDADSERSAGGARTVGLPNNLRAERGTSPDQQPNNAVASIEREVGSHGSSSNKRQSASTQLSPERDEDAESAEASSIYVSPLKRVRAAVAQMAHRRVIETASELKDFILKHEVEGPGKPVPSSASSTIMLRMRLVWTSFDTCKTGPVARMHLVDARVTESVADIQKVFKDGYEDKDGEKKRLVDSELVTASLYGLDSATTGLPVDGSIIRVSALWTLKLFNQRACQLTTTVDNIKKDMVQE